MSWLFLVLASALEAAWALGLPHTRGFTRPLPSVLVALAMVGSFVLLAQAAKTIPATTAYAIWVALGLALAVLVEALVLGRPGGALRWAFLALLIIAVVGLKLTTPKS
ncbi:MAG: multidrug efflux SMR transporter [Deltaproteobacteria bacterium]|nr:multidrug efflux SMR transporter [Deltaproteobacteria bacterium]